MPALPNKSTYDITFGYVDLSNPLSKVELVISTYLIVVPVGILAIASSN